MASDAAVIITKHMNALLAELTPAVGHTAVVVTWQCEGNPMPGLVANIDDEDLLGFLVQSAFCVISRRESIEYLKPNAINTALED